MKNKLIHQFGIKPTTYSLLLKGLIALLLFTQSHWVQAGNYAQQTKLTLSLNNITLKKALSEIEKKSEFYFMYNSTQIDVKQRVSINVVEATIFQILDKMLPETGISYEISNRQIILTPKKINKTSENTFSNDKIIITGTVYDQNEISLPGVSVIIKGSQTGTLTDANGNFEIEASETSDVLVFSFIGFRKKEIAVSEITNPLIVKLEEANISLDEIVVVGYGVTTKKLLTGSVENINAEELTQTASYSLEGALSGKASGI